MKNKKGFTLIEIMIVVVIIGILASLALPRLGNQVKKAAASEAFSILGSMARATSLCYMMNDEKYADCATKDAIEKSSDAKFPDTKNFTFTTPTSSESAHILRATYTGKGDAGQNYIDLQINLKNGKTARCSPDSVFNTLKGVDATCSTPD